MVRRLSKSFVFKQDGPRIGSSRCGDSDGTRDKAGDGDKDDQTENRAGRANACTAQIGIRVVACCAQGISSQIFAIREFQAVSGQGTGELQCRWTAADETVAEIAARQHFFVRPGTNVDVDQRVSTAIEGGTIFVGRVE